RRAACRWLVSMNVEQRVFSHGAWSGGCAQPSAQLVFVFDGGVAFDPAQLEPVRADYPHARLIGCTTLGPIAGPRVLDHGLVATAVSFEHARIEVVSAELAPRAAELTGFELGDRLPKEGLRHVWVLSNGVDLNGAALVRGLRELLPPEVRVSGGLAGDGSV